MTIATALPLTGLKPITALTTQQADYEIVRRILERITDGWREQPGVEDIADAVGLTTDETHLVFRRWCGLTPKAFLQAVTLDHPGFYGRDLAAECRREVVAARALDLRRIATMARESRR